MRLKRIWRLGVLALLTCTLLAGLAWPVAAQQPVGTISTALANVRSGPSTSYSIIAQAPQGTVLNIIGRDAANAWYQVCCLSGISGWIYAPLLVVEGSTAAVPIITVPPPSSVTPPPVSVAGWRGEYFANRNLQGTPAMVRDDASINFRWDGGSPGGGIPGTNFSVRWTRTTSFNAGNYTFYAQVDDGVRLWLDNTLLIDSWAEGSLRTLSQTFNNLGAGNHTIRVEYFQAGGDAAAVVWWEQAGSFPEWKGEYWDNINLQGSPAVVRNDPAVNFNWGLGSPAPQIPVDNFSARWTRRINFSPGNYEFSINVDDGTRVYLNGRLVIDEWHDVDTWTNYTVPVHYIQGDNTVVIEYYARGGIAYCQFSAIKVDPGSGEIP